jgi:alpha-tubulin suppressor-like RCC1 family protein
MNRSSSNINNRSSGTFDVKAHNFGLFSLVKILSVSSGSKAKPKGKIDANSLNNKQDVTIDVVAQGGYLGHEFLALYCSNDHFIFRHVGESGVPLVRRLPWLKDPAKKITAMAFNPTAQWLLCVTHDRHIVLIPIYFIMFKNQESNSMMNSFNDIKMFLASSKNNATRHFNQCVWWRPYNSSEDYGIFGSETGSIRIVNLATKERLRLKTKYPISKIEIIEDITKTSKYLLLNTVGGGYWKLILEQNVGGTSYQSIIKQFNKPPFVLTQINKFGTETALSLQRMHQSEQVIGAYDKSNNKLEIYDALLTKFPLFVFQLFDSDIRSIYLTDKVIFTLRTDEEGWKLGVISRLLSGASANPRWMSKYQKESKLQEFKFGLNERIAGHLPAFVAPKSHVPSSQASPSLSSPTASMGDQLEFTIIDQTIREQQAASKSGDSMTSEPLEGMYIYTRDSVYEVRSRTPPEQIFFELVQQRSASAEALGKTFALDLLALYEAAADSHIHRGDYGRALDLYYLSNVQTSKLVAKFLEVGRMDVIITRLRSTLGEPTALSMSERRRLSNTLLQCYLQKLLQSKEFQYLDEEFQKFLRKNEDYDATKALSLFLEHGLMRYFLLVGDARNIMPRAMQLLATERGSLHIGPEEIKYLTENFLLEHLKGGANGALAKSLPASEQIQLYLADPITVHKYFSRIYSLLPYLTEEVLIQIASYFDPLGENMMKVFSFATSKTAKIMELEVQGGSLNNSSAAINSAHSLNSSSYNSKDTVEEEHAATKEEYVELFLATLFALNYRRQQRSEPQAKKAKSVQYQMVQSFNEKKVSKVTCGWSHTAVITEDGQVYIWGRNNSAQLGLGHTDHKFTPQKLSSLSHVNITHIACGGEHTIAVDESGTVYSWGANDHGQLGLGDTESRTVPTPITELGQVRVKSLACGWSHSMILTDKGLWVFGAGSHGQLGLGDRDDKHAPHLIAFLEGSKVAQWKSVSCGFSHNALLLDNGNVYTWGSGLYGQLGHGDSEDALIPKLLSALVGTHFTSVACGSFHTVAVNDLGNIYLWGRAMKKSKVEQERYEDQLEPKLIEFLMGKQASLIATGHFHTVVVSAQGKVYMWGKSFSANKSQKSNERQRSIAEMFSEVPTPILALKGKRIKQICCGDEFNVVLTERGHVYTWGSGRCGQLGHNSLNDEWAPRLVDSLNEVVNYRVFGDSNSNTNDKKSNGSEVNGTEANGTQKKHLAFDHDEELYGPAMIEATLRGWDAPQHVTGALNSSNALSASTGPGQHATVPYRPHLVLDKALEWNNFSAASIVALQTRRWLLAVYCTLKSYESTFQHNDEDRTDETLSVLGLLNFIVKDLVNVPNREELVYQILQFWHDRKLPLEPLEEHIKDNIRLLAPLLGELLLLQEVPAGSDKSPLCVTLSQDIYFAVVTSYTQIMDENFRKDQSEKVPEEKLLASIRNNLNKDVDVKDKIALSTMLAPIKGPTHVNPGDPTHVAFTCGHYFARDDYQDRILPQFKQRAEQLPIAVPVTIKLLLGEYQQRVMNLACPVCVFNYLRVQQTQIDTRAQVDKWEI